MFCFLSCDRNLKHFLPSHAVDFTSCISKSTGKWKRYCKVNIYNMGISSNMILKSCQSFIFFPSRFCLLCLIKLVVFPSSASSLPLCVPRLCPLPSVRSWEWRFWFPWMPCWHSCSPSDPLQNLSWTQITVSFFLQTIITTSRVLLNPGTFL